MRWRGHEGLKLAGCWPLCASPSEGAGRLSRAKVNMPPAGSGLRVLPNEEKRR